MRSQALDQPSREPGHIRYSVFQSSGSYQSPTPPLQRAMFQGLYNIADVPIPFFPVEIWTPDSASYGSHTPGSPQPERLFLLL